MSDTLLQCVTPSADAAGVRAWEAIDLGADAAAVARVASLTGDATIASGVLSLTQVRTSERRGALLLRAWGRYPALRTLRVQVNPDPNPDPSPDPNPDPNLNPDPDPDPNPDPNPDPGPKPKPQPAPTQFDLMCHGGGKHGGRGVSFNYGPLDEHTPLDESGGEHLGLAVSFVRGPNTVLEVRLQGALLLSRPIDDAWPRRVWSPVDIALLDGGGPRAGTSVTVRISGIEILRDGELVLPDWEPAPFWRVAFAARTPLAAEMADAYELSQLRFGSGLLAASASVPVRVSLNGQQFAPSLESDAPRLTYTSPLGLTTDPDPDPDPLTLTTTMTLTTDH